MAVTKGRQINFRLAVFILLIAPVVLNAQTLYVSETSINVRSGPGLENTIVAVAKLDQPLRLLSESGSWYKVEIPSGKQGWISNKMTKTEKPALYVIRDLKKEARDQKSTIETLLSKNNEGQIKYNKQFIELQELKLKFKILRNENATLQKSRDSLWLAGGVLFALLIWTMGFLAGQYKIKKENQRFHNMATTATGAAPSPSPMTRKATT